MPHLLELPPELLRAVLDRLPRGDQAALACTCRALRDAAALRSSSETQRVAAALRHPLMPWRELASGSTCFPHELHALLSVAAELNRSRHAQAGTIKCAFWWSTCRCKLEAPLLAAPSEWAFCVHRTQRRCNADETASGHRVTAMAPRRWNMRYGPSIARTDVLVDHDQIVGWLHDGTEESAEHTYRTMVGHREVWHALVEYWQGSNKRIEELDQHCYAGFQLCSDGRLLWRRRRQSSVHLLPVLERVQQRYDWLQQQLACSPPESELPWMAQLRALMAGHGRSLDAQRADRQLKL